MLGALTGDVIGSVYEWQNIKTTEFPLFCSACHFTDDSVLTAAVADALLHGGDFVDLLHQYYHLYPDAGWGAGFRVWAAAFSREPYNSWGNGAGMRISPVAYAFDTLGEVLAQAERFTAVTHNHPQGIIGAKAIAGCVFLARSGATRRAIREFATLHIGYDVSWRLEEIRPSYAFNESCQGSVPEAIIAFLESGSFEQAIRNAISIGGDSDTIACMTGAIAEAFYGGVPAEIAQETFRFLDGRIAGMTRAFMEKYPVPRCP